MTGDWLRFLAHYLDRARTRKQLEAVRRELVRGTVAIEQRLGELERRAFAKMGIHLERPGLVRTADLSDRSAMLPTYGQDRGAEDGTSTSRRGALPEGVPALHR